MVEALESGRVTGRELMESAGVSASTLGGWVCAEKARRRRETAAAAERFVAVDVHDDAPAAGAAMEVVLSKGRTLRVGRGFDAGEVVRLVRTLESC
jgi:hypothetical protein